MTGPAIAAPAAAAGAATAGAPCTAATVDVAADRRVGAADAGADELVGVRGPLPTLIPSAGAADAGVATTAARLALLRCGGVACMPWTPRAMRAAVATSPAASAPPTATGVAAPCATVAPPILATTAPIPRTPMALPTVAVVTPPPPAPPAPPAPVPRPPLIVRAVPVPIEASASLTLAIVPALSAAGKASGRPMMMRRTSRCVSIASRQRAHSSMCARRAARPWLSPSPLASAARDRSSQRHCRRAV